MKRNRCDESTESAAPLDSTVIANSEADGCASSSQDEAGGAIFDGRGERIMELQCNRPTSDVQAMLRKPIPAKKLSTRAGPGGSRVTYMEASDVFERANEIFGYNGWGCRLSSLSVDHCERDEKGYWQVEVTAVTRVWTAGGASMGHEDVGHHSMKGRDRGEIIGNAKKAAVTDAKKRTLRLFGDALGNMCYSKEKVREATRSAHTVNGTAPPQPQPPPQPPQPQPAKAASPVSKPRETTTLPPVPPVTSSPTPAKGAPAKPNAPNHRATPRLDEPKTATSDFYSTLDHTHHPRAVYETSDHAQPAQPITPYAVSYAEQQPRPRFTAFPDVPRNYASASSGALTPAAAAAQVSSPNYRNGALQQQPYPHQSEYYNARRPYCGPLSYPASYHPPRTAPPQRPY